MKVVKRIGIGALIFILTVLVFRGWVYRHLFTYKSIGERTNYKATDFKLLQYIDSSSGRQDSQIKSIIETSLSLTSKSLIFTDELDDKDPNKLIVSKRANCIGYAAFFSAVCNRLLVKNNLDKQWIAKPLIGQLYFLDNNIHPYFKSAFFKDHDFAVIENKTTGQVFAVDPSLNDYTGIDFVRFVSTGE
ncbi:hypothetical protein WSM22_30730 [Cytophagales bacterium WSM2-2]|nr:hypothetical protein WSM22_30730 [Cytophagales bacterium WSM2-2]